jgi:uncharacterized membrane protein
MNHSRTSEQPWVYEDDFILAAKVVTILINLIATSSIYLVCEYHRQTMTLLSKVVIQSNSVNDDDGGWCMMMVNDNDGE